MSLIIGAIGTFAGFLAIALILSHGLSGEGLLTWVVIALPFVMLAALVVLFRESRESAARDGDTAKARLKLEDRLREETERWRSQLPQLDGEARLVNLKFSQEPVPPPSDPAHGELESIADYFGSLAAPRLVVLGGAGAGKTVLARELQWQLLTGATAPSPVPVLVSAVAWEPGEPAEPGKPWVDWLTGYLARTYALPDQAAGELVRDGQILPIVDGLNELGTAAALLVASIDASGFPVVITSRPAEYDALPYPLRNASRVYIEAPGSGDIRRYLPGVTEVSAVMSDVLRRPFMLSLAAAVYPGDGIGGSRSNLAELPDETAVDRVLLSGFLASVYPSRGGRWPRERAEQWLVSIGEQMRQLGTDTYTWRSVGLAALPGPLGLAGSAVTAATLLVVLVALGAADGAFWHGHWVRDGLWPVAIYTVAGGAVAGLLVDGTARLGRWLPGSRLGSSARLARWQGAVHHLLLLMLALLGRPTDVAGGTSARDNLSRARGQALAVALLAAVPLAFAAMLLVAGLLAGGVSHPPSGGIVAGVCYCLAVSVLLTPWGTFQLGRVWYAARRTLPYRLMGFLDDAHQRGVLRSAGPVFEFRDPAIRDYATDPARLTAVTRQIAELTDWMLTHPEIDGTYKSVGADRGDIEQAIAALATRTIRAGETFAVNAGSRQAALEQVRLRLNELSRTSEFDRSLLVDKAPGLGAVLDPSRVVPTETMAELGRLIDRSPTSSVGISGLRGIGKSTLIRWLCVDRNADLDFPPLGLLVSAPVEYDAREFLVQLYISLCEAVLSDQRFDRRDARTPRIVWSVTLAAILAAAGTLALDHRAVSHAMTGDSVRHALWSLGTSLLYVGAAFTLVTAVQRWYRERGGYSGPAGRVAAEARQQLRRLRYQLTETTGQGAEFGGHFGLTLSGTRSRAATENQLTLPELVASYRRFAGLAVSALQERAQQERARQERAQQEMAKQDRARGGGPLAVPQVLLVVGIDEIDRIEEAEKAEKFLNDVKAIFGIPNCFYAASLSADALANFERRVVSTRTAFDTTFDTVLRVGPLDLTGARDALERRAIGLPYPFIALCYVLSGGVPRELMRVARTLFEVRGQLPSEPDSVTCDRIAFEVIKRELLSLRQGLIPLVTQLNVPGAGDLVGLLDDTSGWPSGEPEADLQKLRKVFADPAAFSDESGSVAGAAKVCDGMAAAAYLFLTVGRVFGEKLDKTIGDLKDYEGLSEEQKADSAFALLARARAILGVNPALAVARVQAVGVRYELGDMGPPPLLSQSSRRQQPANGTT